MKILSQTGGSISKISEKRKLVMWISEGRAVGPERTRNCCCLEVVLRPLYWRSSREASVIGMEAWGLGSKR